MSEELTKEIELYGLHFILTLTGGTEQFYLTITCRESMWAIRYERTRKNPLGRFWWDDASHATRQDARAMMAALKIALDSLDVDGTARWAGLPEATSSPGPRTEVEEQR